MRISPITLVAACGITLYLTTNAAAAAPSELDGTWVEIIRRPSRAEHPAYSPPQEPETLVIDGHLLVTKGGGRQSLIRFLPGQPTKAADLTTVVGGEFWLTRAIYKVEGDVLTISESGRDRPRPTSFRRSDSSQDEMKLVRTFKRQVATPPKNPRQAQP